MQMTVGRYEQIMREGRVRLRELDRLIAEDSREIERSHRIPVRKAPVKRRPKSRHIRREPPKQFPPVVSALLESAAKLYGVDQARILATRRAVGNELEARSYVMRELRAHGWTTTRIGAALGLHHTTVLYYIDRRR